MGYLITCKYCGDEKLTSQSTTKFCNDKCRSAFNSRRVVNKLCKRCNKSFESNAKRLYCSPECQRKPTELKKPKELKVKHRKGCLHCGSFFMASHKSKRYCSQECAYQMQLKRMSEERERTKTFIHKRCKECGKHFETTRSKACYCSEECSNRYENRRKETARRKRIAKNGKVHWDISIERLMKRDKSICYLCKGQVDKRIDPNADNYPSIEHVIPISKGGTHTWDNVQLAHRKCNYLKSDKLL